jgi:hypothetical protein
MAEQNTIYAECPTCLGSRKHEIVVKKQHDAYIEEIGTHFWNAYYVIQCMGCETFSFAHYSSSTDDVDGDDQPIVFIKLYPSRRVRKPIQHWYYMPKTVSNIYKEALIAIGSEAPTLGAAGLRAVVESICEDKGVRKKNLEKSIDALVSAGFLASEQADFLHLQRYLGNMAIHEIAAPDERELLAAVDIIESLLKTLYILPRIAKEMKRSQLELAKRKAQLVKALPMRPEKA